MDGYDDDSLGHKNVDYKQGRRLIRKNILLTNSPVLNVRFDPEDTMIAAVCGNGSLKIYHLHSDKLKVDVKTGKNGINFPATCVRWRPSAYSSQTKNVVLTGGADGQLVHWHVSSGKELERVEEIGNQINCLDYNESGDHFLTAGSDKKIRLYDESAKAVVKEFKGAEWADPGHNNRIFCVKFLHEDPNLFLSGGWDKNVHLWDIRAGKSVGGFVGPKIAGDSIDCQGGIILTGSNQTKDQLQLWEMRTMSLLKTVQWNSESTGGGMVYACQYSKNNRESILACSFGLNEVRLFEQQKELAQSLALTEFKKGIYSVDYANFSNQFAFAGEEGKIFVYSIAS